MKRRIVRALLGLVFLWFVLWGASFAVRGYYAAKPWPAGLGVIEDVPKKFPNAETTPAAKELERLAQPLGITLTPKVKTPSNFQPALSDYIRAEAERAGDAIQPPPPQVAQLLASNASNLGAVRAHINSGQPIAWPLDVNQGADAPIPNLLGHMQIHRLLIASALERARQGDGGAWDDLRASWILARGLWQRPELISAQIALAQSRTIDGVVRKMPLPEPAWYAEMRNFDYEKAMLTAHMGDGWFMWSVGDQFIENGTHGPSWHARILTAVASPYYRVSVANAVDVWRRSVAKVSASRECSVDSRRWSNEFLAAMPSWNAFGQIAMPNISASWQRFARYRVEREATHRVLAIRRGETPSTASQCADGKWELANGKLRFTGKVPQLASPAMNMALEYAATPARAPAPH